MTDLILLQKVLAAIATFIVVLIVVEANHCRLFGGHKWDPPNLSVSFYTKQCSYCHQHGYFDVNEHG